MAVVVNIVTGSSVVLREIKVCACKPPTLIPQRTFDVDGIGLPNDEWRWFGTGHSSGVSRTIDDDLGDITMCANLLQACKQRRN